ncbi:hypothetical protein WJX84_000549 [Apatococcus fuscideae]|uniref:Serine/threonine-protein phosphatase 4 regulatory subunit 3-like central domain-containing protein n=1 Tax=Apatococcus fuscideae TaxID=2026836 RepID=A0AAW1S1N8_9CHLO
MVAMQRVKVYRLNTEGQWDDKGTGHVSVEVMEQSNAVGLVVVSEEEGSQETRTLLIHRISKEGTYTRQSDDTIISWTDSEIGTDIALSFAEAQGCSFIWEQIQEVQGNHTSPSGPGSTANGEAGGGRKRMVDEFEQVSASIEAGEFQDSTSSGPVDLPPPERGRLADIAQVLTELAPFQRETAGHQMQARGYIRKLLDIFNRCEDLEDTEGLRHMYMIIRGAIMLGDFGVLEVLMSEENVMDTVGALEYEPDLPISPKHRDFLRDKVVFKEVVPIRDSSLRAKIHQTYRMGYVKDVVLPRSLDDNGFTALSSLMLLNNVEVVTSLQQDATFLQELFVRLRASRPGQEEWADLVAFLQELCSLVKHLQPGQRSQLLQKLTSLGLFEHDPQPLRASSRDQPNSILFTLLNEHHGYRIKYYVLRNNVVEAVLKLLWCREKWLAVAAIRFLRCCVAIKDSFYYRYLVRNNHFAPVIDKFLENGGR